MIQLRMNLPFNDIEVGIIRARRVEFCFTLKVINIDEPNKFLAGRKRKKKKCCRGEQMTKSPTKQNVIT